MAGIIEKGSVGLFDNEVEFTGKYATMARFLKEEIGLFSTFREIYVTAAIVGFIKSCEESKDDNEKVQAASIFPNELSKRKKDLRFIYRLIMLLKEEPGFTIDDYKNRTFRDDPEEHMDTLRENMLFFNSYACGGLEYIYNKFSDCNRTEDAVDRLYEFVHGFGLGLGLVDGEETLPDFDPNYD